MLRVAGVTKSYGTHPALRGVDLDVDAGDVVALLGPNGAGKTTLVSIIAGLRRADSGTVHVAGIDVAARPDEVRQHLGLAPQELGVYPRLSVLHNFELFGELAGLRGRALAERIDEVAGQLGLSHLIDRRPATMSGGERRRLHTAIALLHRPALLVLDEPTAGADVKTRTELLELVRKLAADGCAVLYCTHYLAEVEALQAEVAVVADGRLVARGSQAELIAAQSVSEVVLTFDGPAPALALELPVVVDGCEVRYPTAEPDRVVAMVMQALGPAAVRLRSLTIVEPSLERVYLDLTGAVDVGDDGDETGASR